MTTENKQIRHIEGTLASPASSQNKQLTVNVDTGGGTVDLTELIYENSSGGKHVFVTKEQIQYLIESNNITLPSNVWVVTSSEDEFDELIQLSGDINIKINNNIFGVAKSYDIASGTKVIWAKRWFDFAFVSTITFNWTADASIYINQIYHYGAGIINTGSSSGQIYIGRWFSTTETAYIDNTGASNVTCFVKNTNVDLTNAGSGAGNQKVEIVDWDEAMPFSKIDKNITQIRSTVTRQTSNTKLTTGVETETLAQVSTGARIFTERAFSGAFNTEASTKGKYQTPTYHYEREVYSDKLWEYLGNISRSIDSNGNTAFRAFNEPWGGNIQVVDIGDLLSVGTFPAPNYSFIASNLYNNGAGWYSRQAGDVYLELRYKTTGVTYRSTATATAPDQLVESSLTIIYERDRYGNTAEGGATLTGKTLNSTIYHYAFKGTSCIMTNKNDGSIVNCCNVYNNGSGWLSIANTGTYSVYSTTYPTGFAIRQSTAIATLANQSLTMTTVITPS